MFLGRERSLSRSIYKHPNKVDGIILARNNIELYRALVAGDVKGRDVLIGRGTEISGTVYYVNSIVIDKKVKLANEPVQISAEEMRNNH